MGTPLEHRSEAPKPRNRSASRSSNRGSGRLTFNIRFEYFNMKEKCYTCRITLGENTITGSNNPHKMRLLYFDDVGFKASTESNKYLNLHFDEQGCMIANQTNTKIIYIDEQNSQIIIDKPNDETLSTYYRWFLQ